MPGKSSLKSASQRRVNEGSISSATCHYRRRPSHLALPNTSPDTIQLRCLFLGSAHAAPLPAKRAWARVPLELLAYSCMPCQAYYIYVACAHSKFQVEIRNSSSLCPYSKRSRYMLSTFIQAILGTGPCAKRLLWKTHTSTKRHLTVHLAAPVQHLEPPLTQ